MRIRILGSAAAEAWPAIFCDCDTCRRARTAGGKNIRSRASIQIDDIYKIDLPPDTYYHQARYGLDLSSLAHLFITHSHSDHFAVAELEYCSKPFAHNLKNVPIRVYGNETVINAIKSEDDKSQWPVELHVLEPFVPVRAGDLTFMPVIASHKQGEQCLNYVIQSDSKTVLYASDTGVYQQQTIDYLSGLKFDLLIVECTLGTMDLLPKGHMTFGAVLDLRDALAAKDAVRTGTPIVITHFSHNIGLLHDELEELARSEGIQVAYDGMEIDV